MVSPEEIKKDAEEAEKEISHEDKDSRSYFLKLIAGLFMVMILVLWVIPHYAIRMDPEPSDIPSISPSYNLSTENRLPSIQDAIKLEVSPVVRQSAVRIALESCPESEVCYAKAIYYFVREDIRYISDPEREYIQPPEETLLGAGDCEDKAILLYYLAKSIGIRSRIVIIPGHAYNEIYLPDAPSKYKQENGWIALDSTCTSCQFGEIPYKSQDPDTWRRYLG